MKKTIIYLCLVAFVMSFTILPVNAAVSGYNVYAFSGGYDTNHPIVTAVISSGQTLAYNTTANATFGAIVQIPASAVGGYLVVAGITPIDGTKNGTGWQAPSVTAYYPSYCLFSSSMSVSPWISTSGSVDAGEPFSGIVYIPAHDSTLYLFLYSYILSSASRYGGAYVHSNAFIQFVPDTDQSAPLLQQILTQVQNIKNEITSSTEQDQNTQQIVDQMDQLLDQIDDLVQQIEEVTVRPPPDTILPTPPQDLLPPVDPAGQLGFEAVSSLLASPLILAFLLMVFTLAFIRYVLFGKSQ